MTQFALFATLLVVVTAAFILPPLWLGLRRPKAKADRKAANLAIFRDQLAELEREKADGSLLAADFEQARQELQKRLLALSEELRCLVCQNQNIADSNAELAQDLRREIRGMIAAGKSDKEIIDFMVVRYGDFVLYRPPVQGNTLLLWGGPLVLMVLGLFLLVRYLRQRTRRVVESERPLSADEARRAEALLNESEPK